LDCSRIFDRSFTPYSATLCIAPSRRFKLILPPTRISPAEDVYRLPPSVELFSRPSAAALGVSICTETVRVVRLDEKRLRG
jgi:hypothetical protein